MESFKPKEQQSRPRDREHQEMENELMQSVMQHSKAEYDMLQHDDDDLEEMMLQQAKKESMVMFSPTQEAVRESLKDKERDEQRIAKKTKATAAEPTWKKTRSEKACPGPRPN